MRILVVNDDGIDFKGIKILAETFSKEHEVVVIAPNSQRSGFSHSVTIFSALRYNNVLNSNIESYTITGTPADCVKLGVLHILKNRLPDLVLSGINSGPNLGCDIMYSGTVAAASEGSFLNIPSIAISLGHWTNDTKHYMDAANFVKRNLDSLYKIASAIKGSGLLSINYPTSTFKGGVFTMSGINWYDDYYDTSDCGGFVTLKGEPVTHKFEKIDCDVAHIKNGFATVTPLKLDRNYYEVLEELRGKVEFK